MMRTISHRVRRDIRGIIVARAGGSNALQQWINDHGTYLPLVSIAGKKCEEAFSYLPAMAMTFSKSSSIQVLIGTSTSAKTVETSPVSDVQWTRIPASAMIAFVSAPYQFRTANSRNNKPNNSLQPMEYTRITEEQRRAFADLYQRR